MGLKFVRGQFCLKGDQRASVGRVRFRRYSVTRASGRRFWGVMGNDDESEGNEIGHKNERGTNEGEVTGRSSDRSNVIRGLLA